MARKAAIYDRDLGPKAGFVTATLARIPFRDASLSRVLKRGIDLASNGPLKQAMC